MANQSHAANMTQGSIWKLMVRFAIPIFLGNLFQQFYNVADTFIVGNVLGDTALAAIGACGAIYELLVGFGIGIGNGPGGDILRLCGLRDTSEIRHIVRHSGLGSTVRGIRCPGGIRSFSGQQ